MRPPVALPAADPVGPGPRRSARMALINYGMHYSMRWPVRTLTPQGSFVEMPAGTLRVGALIEFVLRFHARGGLVERRLAATVAHVGSDGIALEFAPYDDAVYTDLVNLSA